jgi:hypothetical protein
MTTVADIQRALNARGESLAVDGKIGPKTLAAIMRHLEPSLGELDDARPATLFDPASAKRLAQAHPDIQRIMNEARKVVEFRVLDSQRGRDAQERAFRAGNSKAHFGQSAHNWSPAIAVDLFPAPYDWNNRSAFISLYNVIGRYDAATGRGTGLAAKMKIPMRSGLDWNMDGVNGGDDWDGGHYELFPWRDYAKSAKPFNG